jgi:hypothetical protein
MGIDKLGNVWDNYLVWSPIDLLHAARIDTPVFLFSPGKGALMTPALFGRGTTCAGGGAASCCKTQHPQAEWRDKWT